MATWVKQVGVRLTPAQLEHLEELSARTHRTTSEVIRCLIDQARLAEQPDIVLAGRVPVGEAMVKAGSDEAA